MSFMVHVVHIIVNMEVNKIPTFYLRLKMSKNIKFGTVAVIYMAKKVR